MTWRTVPICDACWIFHNGDRTPYRLHEDVREDEHCHSCGRPTRSGSYTRSDKPPVNVAPSNKIA